MNVIDEAVQLHESGQRQRAISKCLESLQQNPNSATALHLLGLESLQEGDCQRAIHLIDLATQLTTNALHMHLNLGSAYEAFGDSRFGASDGATVRDITTSIRPIRSSTWNGLVM